MWGQEQHGSSQWRGRQSGGADVVGAAYPADRVTLGLTQCFRGKPPELGSNVEALAYIGSNGLQQGFSPTLIGRINPFQFFEIFS
jgi:hypothetical protein